MKYLTLSILTASILFSCSNRTKLSDENKGLTYAEITIKEGGKWNGRKYEGGTFKNVQQMSLNPLHTDHSFDIRYEGPGWENQNVGYRLYLDWRNAVDIYGKKVKTQVLQDVGQDGFDSYHNAQSWGQDILKAGKSIGIGGFGRLINDTVAHFHQVAETDVKINNGKSNSNFKINYKGWKTQNHTTDLQATISIYPYDRFSKFELITSTPTSGLATGIVKFDHIPLKQKTSEDGQWAYIATYGNQTLVNEKDLLGMAILYKTSEVEQIKNAKYDHLIVFKPTTQKVHYYIIAAWEQEPNGIKNEAEFYQDLANKLELLQKNNRLNK